MIGGAGQLVFEPLELRLIHVVAVEHEEPRAPLRECVVALAVHVEWLVVALRRIVVIAERRIERHLRIEQSLVGLFEFVARSPEGARCRRCCLRA